MDAGTVASVQNLISGERVVEFRNFAKVLNLYEVASFVDEARGVDVGSFEIFMVELRCEVVFEKRGKTISGDVTEIGTTR